MMWRSCIVVVLLIGAFATRQALGAPPAVVTAEPLTQFPESIGGLKGTHIGLAADVLKVAAVDDYLNRSYADADRGVGLYVGYYQRQRQGEALHSPLFCLPGSGWQPTATRRVTLESSGGTPATVNELIVERGLDRMMVLYWYQTAYRVTASEYHRKLFLMTDALTTRRTDVALVRVMTRINFRDEAGEAAARALAHPFAAQVLPEIEKRLFR
jgi:EpsI family protein